MQRTIRAARSEDLDAIAEIYNFVVRTSTAIYSETPTTRTEREAWWRRRTSDGYPVLVAATAGGVVGFATYGEFRGWPGYRYTVEHSVHVAPEWQGRGIGRQLMTELLQRAAVEGRHAMIGAVDAANERSIHFHRQLGFQQVALLPEVGFKFQRWLDLVLVHRLVRPASPA